MRSHRGLQGAMVSQSFCWWGVVLGGYTGSEVEGKRGLSGLREGVGSEIEKCIQTFLRGQDAQVTTMHTSAYTYARVLHGDAHAHVTLGLSSPYLRAEYIETLKLTKTQLL